MACATARNSAPPFTQCTLPPRFSTWWTPSSAPNRFSLNEKSSAHHRWRMPRQSRTRRLGRRPALQRNEEGNLEFGEAHHQQSHGAYGGDRGAEIAPRTVRGGGGHRFGIRQERDY